MIQRSIISRRRHVEAIQPDVLQLSESVVPMPGATTASMRFLEFTIAALAFAFAVVLGFAH